MTENSRRSAHATIRGYLYQTCLGVLRWLDLQPNEVLVCEGDQDLDRHLLDGTVVSEQVKAYSGRLGLGDQAVLESLFNFLVTYVALRREDKDRTFIFTTTAEPRPQRKTGLDFDLLEKWREGIRNRKVISAVRSLLKPKKENTHRKEIEEARAWLDGQPEGWVGFMNAVEWTFKAPSLGTLREDILRRLTEREDTSLLPPDTFLERLVVHVLETSCWDQRQDRHVTPGSLTQLIEASRTSLRSWAQSERAKRLRIILDEADPIEELLSENTSSLPRNASPGKLLTAAYEIIPFDEAGRTEEITFLKAWCEGNDPKSVVLLTGEGGSGKTRLMIEWCRRLRHRGWHAGFLLPLTEDAPRDLSPLLNGVSSRLIVVDYAETRLQEVGSLLEKMGQARDKKDPKVRLVLLARRSGDWWNNLPEGRRAVEDLLLDSEPPRSITPLIPKDPERREEAFHLAMQSFAQELDIAPPETPHIPDLASKDFDRVLYLHMAAHATALGQRIETAADALSRTLEHEQLFWRQQVADLKLDGTQRPLILKALKLSVATVTLTYGVEGYQQALSLLNRALKHLPLPAHYLDSLIDLLRNVYGRSGAAGLSIDPLQPDLLGEELVAQNLTKDPGLLGRILEQCSPREAFFTLVVLSRLVRRISKAEKWIAILAKELEGKGTQEIWATLQQLCDDQDYQSSVPLREIAQIATAESLKLFREHTDELSEAEQSEYARLLSNNGVRLSALGRREDALKATEEAVEIYRRLAHVRPDAFLPDLAMSLNNLGTMLSALGRREDALKATEEAVEIYRRLAHVRPDAFLPDLATSLNNLGNSLSALGRREDALKATEEAVEIRRRLAHARPDAFLPDLATSLNNLGNRLSDLGRREDALKATEEAVEIRRRLAHARPDAFLPDLATSLNNLGNSLSDLGRREDALKATEEAVEIRRRLAHARPDAFLPDLATSLNNLGNSLSDLGRREDALKATEEAVEIRRRLAHARPDAFLPDLATSLNNLGNSLSDLGRREDALKATEEAVEIRRRLAHARPDAFLPDLATSLNNLGNSLSDLGRREDALKATEEAVEIRRRLAHARPDAFLPDLATGLNNLGNSLSDLGRREDALKATEEAVEIRRRLAHARPDAFLPDLARSLNNLGNRLSDLGRREDALKATEEAVEIRRRLAHARPDAFLPDLATSLNNLGNSLSDLGRREDALKATEEAVRNLSPFFLRFPAAFSSWMVTMVRNYLGHAKAVDREPDYALLTPILEALQPFLPTPPSEDQP